MQGQKSKSSTDTSEKKTSEPGQKPRMRSALPLSLRCCCCCCCQPRLPHAIGLRCVRPVATPGDLTGGALGGAGCWKRLNPPSSPRKSERMLCTRCTLEIACLREKSFADDDAVLWGCVPLHHALAAAGCSFVSAEGVLASARVQVEAAAGER